MKVTKFGSMARASVCAAAAVTMVVTALASPVSAQAITRNQVMSRARTWIAKKVPYSQRRHYRGYRQDCSGFVSMAWGLKRSYTTRSISRRAYRISMRSLRPGDAILTRGHVSLFGGWKNARKRTYWAYEQTTWGSHAKRHVRRVPRGAKALRRRGLSAPPLQVAASTPATFAVTFTDADRKVLAAAAVKVQASTTP